MLNEPKTVPIILKLCQHNWEKPIHKICCLVHYTIIACACAETVEFQEHVCISDTVILYLPVCGSVMMDLVNISMQSILFSTASSFVTSWNLSL